jgi:hypothetical protein
MDPEEGIAHGVLYTNHIEYQQIDDIEQVNKSNRFDSDSSSVDQSTIKPRF